METSKESDGKNGSFDAQNGTAPASTSTNGSLQHAEIGEVVTQTPKMQPPAARKLLPRIPTFNESKPRSTPESQIQDVAINSSAAEGIYIFS